MFSSVKLCFAWVVTALVSDAPVMATGSLLFSRLLPQGLVPDECNTQRTPLLDQAGMCVMQNNCQSCFSSTPLNSVSRISSAIDFYYTPIDATNCTELQNPICPLTKSCCRVCRSRINSLYRCILRKTPGLSSEVLELQRTCPLDCRQESVPTRPLPQPGGQGDVGTGLEDVKPPRRNSTNVDSATDTSPEPGEQPETTPPPKRGGLRQKMPTPGIIRTSDFGS